MSSRVLIPANPKLLRLAGLVLCVGVLIACSAMAWAQGYANPHLLVEPAWLAEHLDDPNIRIVDVRGDALYLRGHIPGAVSLDGTQAINDPNSEIAGHLLGPEEFEKVIRGLGINDDTIVVVYDQSSSNAAARLFYALEYYGHKDKVRILNGGLAAWTAEERPLESGRRDVAPGSFTARPNPELQADAEYVKAQIGKEGVVILDVRSEGEYLGTDVRAAQGGHIPGATHLEWTVAVEDGSVQRFKPAEELWQIFGAAGVSPDAEIIPYCQTNVRASHTYFVLRLLGFEKIRPYEASWAEWGNRDDVPIVAGREI
ncbi:MAG: sulfurtransferase [Clostridia bacterium]|nr:sulfurtransferase [Bacillota bacterium]MBO2521718.1 sulfurtransferase [Bacillota bacterium]